MASSAQGAATVSATKPGTTVQRVVAVRPASPIVKACETTADLVRFCFVAVREVPTAVRLYLSEVIRQAGILVVSSGPVIWFLMFSIGCEVGLQGHYLLGQLGAGSYVGVFTTEAGLKGAAADMFCWILAAKVSCGYVAEIGSMRISEEIDALAVMGIRTRPYLVGTRVAAFWLAAPFLFLVGLGILYIGSWLFAVPLLHTVSPGGYFAVFWAFQTPLDILKDLIWAMAQGTVVVLVGCYFGYTASGGPVGVGHNTAKSMMVNMVVVGIFGMIMFQLLFGTTTGAPIGN